MGALYRYKVYMTPLSDSDMSEYGEEIDVSEKIEVAGIGSIKKTIDSDDYDIGVFVYSDLTLKGLNVNGYFNDPLLDSRSIFKTTRDRCKVRVVFEKITNTKNTQGTLLLDSTQQTITYNGLINEEATRIDIVEDSIQFKVLSRDSVLRTTKISAGVVSDGDLASEAFYQILNTPRISSILNVDPLNISPAFDHIIEHGSEFDDKSVKEMLDLLLFTTVSVMVINDDADIIIKDRNETDERDILNLYGKSDELGRENILDLNDYNTGKHRQFTSIRINDTQVQNAQFAEAYGFREKHVDVPYVSDIDLETQIAERIVDEFKFPKIEIKAKIMSSIAKDVRLFDRVSVNYPLRVKPIPGTFLPVVGATKIGDPLMPLPRLFGSVAIPPRIAFKVIEIEENPSDFTTTLKLRQAGKSYDDGYYDNPASSIVGYAVVGISKIKGVGDPADEFNPSVVGAAVIGLTRTE